MKFILKNLKILPVLIMMTMVISCAGVGMMAGGASQHYSGKYSIELTNPRADILDIISEVGKSMALRISQFDAKEGVIALSSESSTAEAGLIGKYGDRSIMVTIGSGKELDIMIMVGGNFGAGTKETADKFFNDFKNKLLERIKS